MVKAISILKCLLMPVAVYRFQALGQVCLELPSISLAALAEVSVLNCSVCHINPVSSFNSNSAWITAPTRPPAQPSQPSPAQPSPAQPSHCHQYFLEFLCLLLRQLRWWPLGQAIVPDGAGETGAGAILQSPSESDLVMFYLPLTTLTLRA